jgi:transcriptional regulator with XRE-family HTH domain
MAGDIKSDNKNKEIFARNLTHYMSINGKTRQNLTQDLGIPYTTISAWCKGELFPRIDKIERLAEYFGVEKSDLIEPKDPTVEMIEALVMVSSVKQELIALVRTLDDETAKRLLLIAKVAFDK